MGPGYVSRERRVRFADGRFLQSSLRNKKSGRNIRMETIQLPSFVCLEWPGRQRGSWHWKLHGEHSIRGAQGELELDVALGSSALRVTKHYVVYPGTAVIREWLTIQNSSDRPVRIDQLDFLHFRVLAPTAQDLQLNYLTGGGITTAASS